MKNNDPFMVDDSTACSEERSVCSSMYDRALWGTWLSHFKVIIYSVSQQFPIYVSYVVIN